MNDLGAVRVGELVNKGLLAAARSDREVCMEVLGVVMCEGTKLDCLAFTMGCLGSLAATVDQDYAVVITKNGPESEVELLAALMLIDYLAGDMYQCHTRWLAAADDTAAGVTGFILRVAGERMRTVWARLS